MEANYSNYDRSQIKLIFKAPNKPQRVLGFVLFCFFTSLLIHNMEPQTQKSNCVGGQKVLLLTNISLKTTIQAYYRSCFSDDAYLCLSAQ